jgi:type IV pilus assembly protein PilQ
MELRARPSITPENKVDMDVNVEISSLTTDLVNSQPVRSTMETRTNMIIQDNQTLLLGGILFQKDSAVESKVPLFGDIPLIGGLFRHSSIEQTNSEMLVFITPRVIDETAENIPEATKEKIEQSTEKLEDVKEQLQETADELAWEMP